MKALIMYGGWDGHQPKEVSEILERELKAKGVEVVRQNTLDGLLDAALVASVDVIVPIWTMGKMSGDQWKALEAAVKGGKGVAGVHGGMGDAFRDNLGYQWMVGGQFVGHPHVGDYDVRLTHVQDPITAGMPLKFPYKSEQYYMIVDPMNTVLAETTYVWDGKNCSMPVVWKKTWGKGRVFYSALGHCAKEFVDHPEVLAMTIRGILWAGTRS